MDTDVAREREQAHAYLDRLPPTQLSAVRSLLQSIVDPLSMAITHAPSEDEEPSDEEKRTAAEAREWLKHNQPISHEDILAEFGLTLSDFEQMGKTPQPDKPQRR